MRSDAICGEGMASKKMSCSAKCCILQSVEILLDQDTVRH